MSAVVLLVGALAVTIAVLVAGSPSRTVATGRTYGVTTDGVTTVLATTPLLVAPDLAQPPYDVPRTVLAPQGWQVSLWARVEGARLAVWAPDGRLVVSRPGKGDVVALRPRGAGTPQVATLASGLRQPHGLAFDATTLYVAQSDRVDAWSYGDGGLADQRAVASDLPDDKSPELGGSYAHALKSVVVGADGSLYFSIGSAGNISEADRSAVPERASIQRVAPGGGEPQTFARGVRNGTGLAVAPDGAVWTAVNGRDNTAYPWPDRTGAAGLGYGEVVQAYVDEHPVEQLAELTPGRDLGWPYCNTDPDVLPGEPTTTFAYAMRPFVRDVQLNPDGDKLDCDSLAPVEQGFPAHSAPLGLSFTPSPGLPEPYGMGALAGVHGSWNRQVPREPEVSFFPYRDGALGDRVTLLSGFQGGDGSRWGRPVAAVVGPDGAVYVTDDAAGAVYRLEPAA